MTTPLGEAFARNHKSPAHPTGYPKDWVKISKAFRKSRGYKCEICEVDCSANTELVEAHHIDGVKSNCEYRNLKCLCIYHHWKESMHAHHKPTEDKMKRLCLLWEEQNIPVAKTDKG